MSETKKPKTLTDKNGVTIQAGSVVRYGDGWVRVSAIFTGKQEVNLSGVFNGKIYHKHVPVADVYEDHASWYTKWTKSESYQSM